MFGGTVAEPFSNKSIIIELLTENVHKEFDRIKNLTNDIVQQQTSMPWGKFFISFQ